MARHPLCAYCLKSGKAVKADVVDHIEPHKGDMVKFWAGPFQSLCHTCHSSVKAKEDAGNKTASDADGNPTDAWHPWNR